MKAAIWFETLASHRDCTENQTVLCTEKCLFNDLIGNQPVKHMTILNALNIQVTQCMFISDYINECERLSNKTK